MSKENRPQGSKEAEPKEEVTLSTEVSEALAQIEQADQEIVNLKAKQATVLIGVEGATDEAIKQLTTQTEAYKAEKHEFNKKMDEIRANITSIDQKILKVLSLRLKLGDKSAVIQEVKKTSSAINGKLKRDISEALDLYGTGIEISELAKVVAEKRGNAFSGSARQGIEKYCNLSDGKVIGMR